MFGCLLNSKFYNKCKRAIKCIRARLDLIRRKKQAMLKYTKKDVADLITDGFATIAFSRMEGLIVDINQMSCYDMIEQFCEDILKQLKCLQKQRECTEEAKEAVSTLIFAAARFPDLPELCKLRRLFTDRYGSQLESYVNSEFVEKVQKRSFSNEKKLQVMQTIAKDLSIGFDAKAFERSLSDPPEAILVQPKKGTSEGEEPALILSDGHKEGIASERRGKPPAGILQKHEVQVEPKDIHVVPNANGSHLHEKSRKLSASKSENTDHYYPDYAAHSDDNQRRNQEERNYDQIKDGPSRKGMSFREQFDSLGQEKQEFISAEKSSGDKMSKFLPPYTKTRQVEIKDHPEKENGNMFANDRSGLGGESGDGLGCDRRSEAKAGLDPFSPEKQGVGMAKAFNGKSINWAPPYTKPNGPRVENRVEGEHIDYVSNGKSAADPVRPASDERAVNMVPPYSKPKFQMPPLHDDQDIEDDMYNVVREKDSLKNQLPGDERLCLVSVRRKFAQLPVMDSNGGAIDDENIVGRTPSGQKRHTSRRNVACYEEGYNPKITDLQRQITNNDEMDNVIDNGKTSHRTPSSRRNTRKQNSDENEEMDSAIDYGKLLHRIPSGQRRPEGRSSATYHGDSNEEEQIVDKLLLHYSRKGPSSEPAKTRTRTRPPKSHNAMDEGRVAEKHDDDIIRSHIRDSAQPPERAASFPAVPVSPAEGVELPARSTSMQADSCRSNGGRVHPRLPDYDKLAARLSALRKT